ncbi:MAG: hypothetical protein JW810_09365 [Sedimentisphaerales bacterium]|nr:hypothetical protein [Sedimentisphaerales bacterium]
MAVVAPGSRHTRNTNLMIVIACVIFAGWFLYDGWFNESFKQKHLRDDGTPDATLESNRLWVPLGCAAVAVFFLYSTIRLKRRSITADEQAVASSEGLRIAYSSIQRIDKRLFDKEGHFTLFYTADGVEKKWKLTDRMYDQLGLLLDEIVRRTGAVPAEQAESAAGPQTPPPDKATSE